VEAKWHAARFTWTTQGIFAELDALSDGASDTIYLREHIACRYSRATGRPKVAGSRIRDLEFRNWMADGAWGGQIGSDPGLRAALGGRGAGGWVPGNCHLREAPEGEVETGSVFHLNDDVC